jgi:hypothetical protein
MLDEREHVGETVNNKTRDPKLLNRKPYQGCVPRYGYIERMRLKSKGMIVTKQGTIRPAVGPIAFPEEAVGRQIMKVSGKPFKSKGLYNTVSGVTENPHTDRVAFTYEEDDSVVDAHICKLRA